jgi:hypothetical protein
MNAYMRYALACHALRRHAPRLDAKAAKAIKRLERLPLDATDERAKWTRRCEKAMCQLARLQHEVQANARQIAMNEGRVTS